MNFKHIFTLFLIIQAVISCSSEPAPPHPKTNDATGVPPPSTTVQWLDSSLDLGKIPMGDSAVFYFRFTNTGSSPLILQNPYTGCSCTAASYTGTAIAPGMTDSIKAVFDTRKSVTGFISKTIQVRGNMVPGRKVLRYRAVITGHRAATGLRH